MKKKIYGLFLSICLFFAGIFSFSGCSLVSEEGKPATSAVVMKIGNTNVTKNDLINAFYTYYQNNSSYFAYYDEATIEESFYTWFTVKTMVEEISYKALYDAETNKNGYIYYTNEDAKTVWGYVEDYFYSQISSYEKALYSAEGVSEEDYPVWLHDHGSEEEEASGFEYYKSPVSEIEFRDRSQDVAKKLTADEVYKKVADIEKYIFQYSESDEHEDHEHTDRIDIVDDGLEKRNQAHANYIQALVSNAKANGTSTNEDEVFKAEVLRIYEAYYESQIGVIFQNFYVQDYLLDYNGNGDKTTLNDRAVVAKFLDKYYTDLQTNQLQDGYVSKMESSEGASLMMYHYQGRDYYFSVQHILVQFTSTVMEQVQNLTGYGVTNANEAITKKYLEERDSLATKYYDGILTKVNKDAQKDSIVVFGDYYYYDEAEKETWEPQNNMYYGYAKLTTHEFKDGELKFTSTGTYTNSEGKEITFESDEAVLMASVKDVEDTYKHNYGVWTSKAAELLADAENSIDDIIGTGEGTYEELRYVLEVVENINENSDLESDALVNAINDKISSLLFVELEWIFSGDALGNEISNKIGYIVSSQDDNNMNWVVDFAVGARNMLAEYKKLDDEAKITYMKPVITDYGYHIIKIEEIYDSSNVSIIDLDSVQSEYSLEKDSEYVKEVTKLLKKTYLCGGTNQTLYEYFYDEAYNTLVGTSSSSGTYFLALEYNWLSKYYEENKIEIIKKVDYQELLGAIS